MAKYCLKKASKRVSCAKRYKIEKKVRDHNRKVKRDAKKNGTQNKKEKTISVPNSCPFKEEILLQAEQEREKIKARQEAAKEAAKLHRVEKRKKNLPANFESMVAKAAKQGADFDKKAAEAADQEKFNTLDDKTIKAYASEVRKTIEIADVIIQVLDARDPLGSRSKSVEEQVLKGGKRLVLLLNKIDLVPRENVQKWLEYLRGQFPTIAFKASTQEQKSNIGRFNSAILNNTETSKCVGADIVMKILANYCRNKDIKTSIRVGVVGFPNVGKSSVINSLKRRKACSVGNLPGITKEMQEVELDKNIRLIDSPGVILASQKDLDPIEVALKNAIRVDNLLDPIAPIHAILRRCSKDTLMMHYTLADFNSVDQFLAQLARRIGKLRRGARPDMNAAAKRVLNDWNTGKLRYYTHPPEQGSEKDVVSVPAEVVSQFSKEFDIDAIADDQNQIIEGLPMESDIIAPQNSEEEDEDDDDEQMETEAPEEKKQTVTSGRKVKGPTKDDEKPVMPESLALEGNVQLNKLIKNAIKKSKKKAKKTANRADKLSDSLGNMLGGESMEM
ncbi:CBN-NST-1 protein [Caenorhabditis brenneri]|uniref:Guanine nucleotide-binding protein-like 3 homolog n=2 Tax=Caenorhabditis brenneri TaxID=135651 RepID=G0NFI3_CAEBE|nr:CBN-NST-1 protein [Caenorhabditis brenneri]